MKTHLANNTFERTVGNRGPRLAASGRGTRIVAGRSTRSLEIMRVLPIIVVVLGFGAVMTVVRAEAENRKLWSAEEDTTAFIAALKERNIPFRRDSEGGIWYPASQVRAVDEISAVVLKRCIGVNFEDSVDQAEFVARMQGANIPFKSCRIRGRDYLYWEPQFEARAIALRDAVDDESMRRSKEQRERTRAGK
jgi:hypothetical protein